MKRTAGILFPIFSLPSAYGIGCFSKEAYDFVDFLQAAGQSYWQILPLHPTGYGDSPYQSFSVFAGNPYFIDLQTLIAEGVLTKAECDAMDWGEPEKGIAYEKQYQNRYALLRKAYERSDISKNQAYQQFLLENDWWLAEYALFMAVKRFFGGKSWQEWPEDIRFRYDFALEYYRRELYFEIEFQKYMQFQFFTQYGKLKEYANERNVQIIGDIPIYAAMDSADAWANPALFQLDEIHQPIAVAGCPPDGFSAEGQRWGNPLYRWEYHKETGYDWWLSRLRHLFRLYDVVRIDHFRGFDAYYAIPYGAKTAAEGRWENGPGMDFFRTAEQKLGRHEMIAEDLGFLTDSVRQLVQESGFLSMKVLEFAFDSRDFNDTNVYLPHTYPENCVVYTGTHDNETLCGWLRTMPQAEQAQIRAYLSDWYTPAEYLPNSLIALAMRSAARLCIIPLQDYLGAEDRINTPSTVGENWQWRVKKEQLSVKLQHEIREMTRRYGRMQNR